MHIDVLSLFPDYLKGPLGESILKRAIERNLLSIDLVDIRDFATGKHRQVDDRPYGGGPGMVLMPGPVTAAVRSVKQRATEDGKKSHVVYMSPQGQPLDAAKCRELSQHAHLTVLCGHYEGIDQRALDSEVDEELSIGDYVLTNGCLAALVLIDALARFIPGVIGHEEAASQDSFEEGVFDCPHYTRPEVFEGVSVPDILLSGHHKNIELWRREQGLKKTARVRPDLYAAYLEQQR